MNNIKWKQVSPSKRLTMNYNLERGINTLMYEGMTHAVNSKTDPSCVLEVSEAVYPTHSAWSHKAKQALA